VLNGAKIGPVWDGSLSRRDKRIQPRVSTLGTGPRDDAPCKGARCSVTITRISCVIMTWLNPSSLVLVHIIFYTKNRSPFLQSTEVRSQAKSTIAGSLIKMSFERDERYVWD
jgi:hypothetical protein